MNIHDFPLAQNILDIFEKRLQRKGQKGSRYFLRKYRKLIFLRNDRDYNDVDLQKRRKRFHENFVLASKLFLENKETKQSFLENQRGIAGVRIFDTTPASMRAT